VEVREPLVATQADTLTATVAGIVFLLVFAAA